MYEAYYGFSQPPFGLSPDVHFCYRHRSYSRAKAYMQYAVLRGEGFLVVTGRPGMGKTTLIQDLLGELGSRQRLVARIDSTQLDADDLLRLVAYAFGIPARGLDKATLVHSLGDFLSTRPESAGPGILVVDEAQNLSDRSLEELRLVTNLQRGARALIQIFLVGQESLRDVIRQRNLEQLQQRIVAACHLEPLDAIETRAYIRHRLLCAGWSGDPVLEAEALRLIYKVSKGVPRLINKVCDRLLLHGSVEEIHSLRGEDAQLVISEFQDEFLEQSNGEALVTSSSTADQEGAQQIEDLRAEPETPSPFQGLFVDAEPESPSQAGVVTPTGRGAPDMAEATAHSLETRTATSPSLPFAHDGRAEEAETGDFRGLFGPQRGAEHSPQPDTGPFSGLSDAGEPRSGVPPFGAPALRTSENAGPAVGAAPGRSGHRRHTLPFWVYAAAAALLLLVGGLLIVQRVKGPHELAAEVSQLGDSVMDKLKSLTGQPSGDPDPAGPDPGGEPSPPSASSPPLAGTGLTDPIGLGRGAYGGSDVASSGDRPSETASDALPRSAEPTPKHQEPATLVEETPQTAGHSDTIGLETAESDTARQSRIASAGEASPAPTEVALTRDAIRGLTSDLGSSPENPPVPTPSGSLDHEESTSPPVTAEPVNTDAIAIEEGRADAPGQGEPSLSLESELQNLGLPIRELGDGRLAFDLGEEVSFASDSARLPDRAIRLLDPLAAALLRNPETQITLVGHTDERGPADYNRRLSLSRARAVAAYLSRQGVPEERLSSQGMGKDAPLPEDDGTPRARQRRVEVIIEPIAR